MLQSNWAEKGYLPLAFRIPEYLHKMTLTNSIPHFRSQSPATAVYYFSFYCPTIMTEDRICII